MCFEQVDEIDTGDFKYVGAGHGTYEQVTFIPEARKSPLPGLRGGGMEGGKGFPVDFL